MFLDTPYVVSAQALSNAKLLHVSKTVIFEELENHHDLAHKMLASMAMRLHQLMNDVESYSLQSSKQRVIGYLMRELPENSQNATNIVLTLSSNKGLVQHPFCKFFGCWFCAAVLAGALRACSARGAEDGTAARRNIDRPYPQAISSGHSYLYPRRNRQHGTTRRTSPSGGGFCGAAE